MMLKSALFLGAAVLASQVTAMCYDTETPSLMCYRDPDGTPQAFELADLQKVAAYLRKYGKSEKLKPKFLTMLPTDPDGADCPEWSLYSTGTTLALGKHIDPTLSSSVLFEDIANTIDGGAGATDAQKAKAIISCLTDGGAVGVIVNTTHPAYSTDAYKAAKYTPQGIIIKVVHV